VNLFLNSNNPCIQKIQIEYEKLINEVPEESKEKQITELNEKFIKNLIEKLDSAKKLELEKEHSKLSFAFGRLIGVSSLYDKNIKNTNSLLSLLDLSKSNGLLLNPICFKINKLISVFFYNDYRKISQIMKQKFYKLHH